MATAIAKREAVDVVTGEVLTPAPFNAKDYLASINTQGALDYQRQLAAAYDSACAALIGPNDTQQEGGRSFKKKSAWRKLARHFGISCELVRVEREILSNGEFLATVVARAVAQWGQHYEEVGACCTDEATGRRVITVADAIATASTRASNRAVSNLIAMGEVSAEEIGDRAPRQDGPRNAAPARQQSGGDGGRRMPFGKTKGKLLTELSDAELESAVNWCSETPEKAEKFADLIADMRAVWSSRGSSQPESIGAEEEPW